MHEKSGAEAFVSQTGVTAAGTAETLEEMDAETLVPGSFALIFKICFTTWNISVIRKMGSTNSRKYLIFSHLYFFFSFLSVVS